MADAANARSNPSAPPTRICVFASTLAGHSPANLAAARALANVFHDRGIHLIYGGGTTGLMGELARERVRLGGPDSVTGVIPGALVLGERGAFKEGTEWTPVQEPEQQQQKASEGRIGQVLKGLTKKDKGTDASKAEALVDESSNALLSSATFGAVKVTPSLAARKSLMMELVAKGGPGSGFIAMPGGFGTFDEIGDVLVAKQMGFHRCKMVLLNVEGFWDGILQWMETGMIKGIVRDEAKEMLLSRDTAEECVQILAADEEVSCKVEDGSHTDDGDGGEQLFVREHGEADRAK